MMKRLKPITLLTFMLMLLSNCGIDNDNKLSDATEIPTYQIESIEVTDNTAVFSIICEAPENCWEFSSYDNSISGSNITVTVFGQRTTNDFCLQVLTSMNVTSSITVPVKGEYTFKFWQHNGATLDTTIII